MRRPVALLAACALPIALAAHADELIRQANDQESLILGISHLHAGVQAFDKAGASVLNEESGPQIQIGYGNTRMRTFLGLQNFYTNVEISFGLSQQDYDGNSYSPSTGARGTSNGPFNVETEAMRLRVGYSQELGAGRRVALTPFVGLVQLAWLRAPSTYSGLTAYYHYAAEAGLLAQASLTRNVVFGVDASIGRTFGSWQLDSHDLIDPHAAITTSFALYLDNRTTADWHQRLEIRESFLRYGEPARTGGFFEPRRNSALSFTLEFGTELNLFESLFH